MLAASRPSKLPVHEPLLGGEVKKPILVVPPGQVLKGLFPAHQTCTGAGATQVPVGGAPLQLFCAKDTTLPTESSIGSSPYVIRTFIFRLPRLRLRNSLNTTLILRGGRLILTQLLCHSHELGDPFLTKQLNNLEACRWFQPPPDVHPVAT